MKFKGQKDGYSLKKVTWFPLTMTNEKGEEKDINLKLLGYSLKFHRQLTKELPMPSPPMVPKTRDGKPVFDTRTNEPVLVPNTEDPDYKEKLQYLQGLWGVAIVVEGLREDETIEFEYSRGDFDNVSDYYEAILQELSDAGFSIGVLSKMGEEVNRLSGVRKEDIEKAKDFFSGSHGSKTKEPSITTSTK